MPPRTAEMAMANPSRVLLDRKIPKIPMTPPAATNPISDQTDSSVFQNSAKIAALAKAMKPVKARRFPTDRRQPPC